MEYTYDYSKLKGKIKELEMTLSVFASSIGMTEQTLHLKLKGKSRFTQDEIRKSMQVLKEPIQNVHVYFFTRKIVKNNLY